MMELQNIMMTRPIGQIHQVGMVDFLRQLEMTLLYLMVVVLLPVQLGGEQKLIN